MGVFCKGREGLGHGGMSVYVVVVGGGGRRGAGWYVVVLGI